MAPVVSSEDANRYAQLLESVARDQLAPEKALEQWGPVENEQDDEDGNSLVGRAWHSLHHYWQDYDIRAEDPAYETHKKQRLMNFAIEIRSLYLP